MVSQQVKQRIEALKREINRHRYRYHVLDAPKISDAAWDSLKKELADLEDQYPQFITSDSPTQRVGGKPLDKFSKVSHPQPMLSLNDAFSREDVEAWQERIKKLLSLETALEYFLELKIDGLAIELIYRDGVLALGATRGDGTIGEDVTQNLKTVGAIPLVLRQPAEWEKEALEQIGIRRAERLPREVVVRGEVFMTKKEFGRLNKDQKYAGGQTYANPRNVAAGSIRQLDPRITASRRLDSFAYALLTDLGQRTHSQEHDLLRLLGFKTNPENRLGKDLAGVESFHHMWGKRRERLPYEIDGIVVIVNPNDHFQRLGVVGKAPRGAIAYKFAGREATTVVEDIRVQVGRTGALTPVAVLRPVSLGGIRISRASLHNEDEIKRLGLKIGDTVVVERAGDVIPKVTRVLEGMRTGAERAFRMPRKCPLCGSAVVRKPGEVVRYCVNPGCFGQQRERIIHFVARNAFDIEGLGEKIVEQLINESLITDPADVFRLTEGDLTVLERFAEKSARNLIEAVQAKKRVSLPRLLVALSIRHVGEETAIDLARHFGSLEMIQSATLEELQAVPNIGGVVAESIHEWFRNGENRTFIEKLRKAGVKIERKDATIRRDGADDGAKTTEETRFKSRKFQGLTFVFTGQLETLPRDEAQEKVRESGGEVSASVSKNTDYVVIGDSPGSKYEKAKKLGVKTINEKEFLQMLS